MVRFTKLALTMALAMQQPFAAANNTAPRKKTIPKRNLIEQKLSKAQFESLVKKIPNNAIRDQVFGLYGEGMYREAGYAFIEYVDDFFDNNFQDKDEHVKEKKREDILRQVSEFIDLMTSFEDEVKEETTTTTIVDTENTLEDSASSTPDDATPSSPENNNDSAILDVQRLVDEIPDDTTRVKAQGLLADKKYSELKSVLDDYIDVFDAIPEPSKKKEFKWAVDTRISEAMAADEVELETASSSSSSSASSSSSSSTGAGAASSASSTIAMVTAMAQNYNLTEVIQMLPLPDVAEGAISLANQRKYAELKTFLMDKFDEYVETLEGEGKTDMKAHRDQVVALVDALIEKDKGAGAEKDEYEKEKEDEEEKSNDVAFAMEEPDNSLAMQFAGDIMERGHLFPQDDVGFGQAEGGSGFAPAEDGIFVNEEMDAKIDEFVAGVKKHHDDENDIAFAMEEKDNSLAMMFAGNDVDMERNFFPQDAADEIALGQEEKEFSSSKKSASADSSDAVGGPLNDVIEGLLAGAITDVEVKKVSEDETDASDETSYELKQMIEMIPLENVKVEALEMLEKEQYTELKSYLFTQLDVFINFLDGEQKDTMMAQKGNIRAVIEKAIADKQQSGNVSLEKEDEEEKGDEEQSNDVAFAMEEPDNSLAMQFAGDIMERGHLFPQDHQDDVGFGQAEGGTGFAPAEDEFYVNEEMDAKIDELLAGVNRQEEDENDIAFAMEEPDSLAMQFAGNFNDMERNFIPEIIRDDNIALGQEEKVVSKPGLRGSKKDDESFDEIMSSLFGGN